MEDIPRRSGLTFEDRSKLEEYHVGNGSPWLDFVLSERNTILSSVVR